MGQNIKSNDYLDKLEDELTKGFEKDLVEIRKIVIRG